MTGKKASKCAKTAKKLFETKKEHGDDDDSDSDEHSVVKRDHGHHGHHGRHGKRGGCMKEAWRLRHRCSRFAKCCPISNE